MNSYPWRRICLPTLGQPIFILLLNIAMHGSCIRSHIPNRASASLLPRDIPFARHSFFCFVLSRRWKKYCVVFQGWEETVWLTISLQLFSPTIHILVERLNCLKINSEGNLFYSESMRKINIKYFFFCFSFKYLLYWIFFSFFFLVQIFQ